MVLLAAGMGFLTPSVVGLLQRWAIIGLATACTFMWVYTAGLKADMADLQRQVATEKADRESAARVQEAKLAKREQEHAAAQQEKEDAYNKDKQDFEKRIADERVATDRLRKQLAITTARANSGDSTDPLACERAFYRLEELGNLAGEGAGLLQEARELLQERDRDIQRLFNQITVDRAAIGQPV